MRNTFARKVIAVTMAFVLVFTSNSASFQPIAAAWAADSATALDTGAATDAGASANAGAAGTVDAATAGTAQGGDSTGDGAGSNDAASDNGAQGDAAQGGNDILDNGSKADSGVGGPNDSLADGASGDNVSDGAEADETADAEGGDDEGSDDDSVSAQADDATIDVKTTISWIDNNENRPSADKLDMHLSFKVNNEGGWKYLTQENLATAGIATGVMPTMIVEDSGTNSTIFSVSDLPTSVGEGAAAQTVSWKITEGITDIAAVGLVVQIGANRYCYQESGSDSDLKATHTLLKDAVFKVKNLTGMDEADYNKSAYQLYRQVGSSADNAELVQAIEQGKHLSHNDADDANVFTLTVPDVLKYDTDNNEYNYSVLSTNQTLETGQVISPQETDLFVPSYENAASDNHGTDTTRAFEGGTVVLTRTNATTMTVTKKWLDNNNAYGTRPAVSDSNQLYLWRYTNEEGNTFKNAAQVLDGNGWPVGADLPSADGAYVDGQVVFSYRYTGDASNSTTYLPKYDADGFAYVYLARETLNASGYAQVYGEVAVDGSVTDTYAPGATSRNGSDKGIYNGGTISNRLQGTANVQGKKAWVAAAHQNYLDGYKVVMQLQACDESIANPAEADWRDVEGSTVELEGFEAEEQTESFSASASAYSPLGVAYQYRWHEAGVYYKDDSGAYVAAATGTVTEPTGETASVFYTNRNVDESGINRQNVDWYKSTLEEDAETGTLVATNKLEGLIDYKVVKQWYGTETDDAGNQLLAEPAEGTALTINLYQNGNLYQTYDMTKVADGTQTEGIWEHLFTDLPKYDDEGRLYDYYAMEVVPAGYFGTYSYDEQTRTLSIENHPGVGGAVISVAKEWIDDSNTAHRLPVVVQVADNAGHSKEVTLSKANNWWELVDVKGFDLDSITVTEVALLDGDTRIAVQYGKEGYGNNGYVESAVSGDASQGYQYEVVNNGYIGKVDGYDKYTVSNRRIGEVDIKVTKEWIDGLTATDNRPAATLSLTSDEGHTIAAEEGTGWYYFQFTGDSEKFYIYTDAAETQHLTASYFAVPKESSSEKTFYNLPKFDKTGKIVHYTVSETWDGEHGDWQASTKQVAYELGATLHTNDHQEFGVTNQLSGSKAVSVNKTWDDVYQYLQGNRPDITLTVWCTDHDANGNVVYKLYNGDGFMDYQWNPRSGEDSNQRMYKLTANFGQLPKYDSAGFEVVYYFEEGIPAASATNFDYTGTSYQDDAQTAVDETSAGNWVVANGSSMLLKEGGTFVNSIANAVTLSGVKTWVNLPDGYPAAQIPSVVVQVYQTVDGTVADGAAPIAETNELVASESGTTISYHITHTGTNTAQNTASTDAWPEDAKPLDKYDSQGNLYQYVLKEKYTTGESTDWSRVYQPKQNGYSLSNVFQTSNGLGQLTVSKDWTRTGVAAGSAEDEYPEVTFKLYQLYWDGASDSYVPSSSSAYATKTLVHTDGAQSDSVTFGNLPVYSPDGASKFKYYIEETTPSGYESTPSGTGFTADTAVELNAGATADVAGAPVTVSVANSYQNQETVAVAGTKKWSDYRNAAQTRPDSITLTVTRHAAKQGKQSDNSIGSQQVQLQTTDPTGANYLQWTSTGATDDNWTYTISNLQKWAPNGSGWIYQITEEGAGDAYHARNNGTVSVNAGTSGSTVSAPAIENQYFTSVKFVKTWDDQGNAYGTRPSAGVKYKVMVSVQDSQVTDAQAASLIYDTELSALPAFATRLSAIYASGDGRSYGVMKGDGSGGTRVSGNTWTVQFSYLPDRMGAGANVKYLYYTIVEVGVPENEDAAFIDGGLNSYFQSAAPAVAKSGTTATATVTNKLRTTKLALCKQWDDDDNYYGLRAQAKFKLGWRVAGSDSEFTELVDKFDIVLDGSEDTPWMKTIEGLPACDAQGNNYQWQAREVGVPEGYTASEPQNTAAPTVKGTDETTIKNTINTASLSISKLVESNGTTEPLSDATIECYKGSELLFTWVSGVNGQAKTITPATKVIEGVQEAAVTVNGTTISGLPEGTYTLKEVRHDAANEKVCQELQATFTVTAAGMVQVGSATHGSISITGSGTANDIAAITLTDELAMVDLTVSKFLQVHDEKQALGGVEFYLYQQVDKSWVRIRTDEALTTSSGGATLGKLTIANLEVGSYYLEEASVPDNVVKSTAKYYFQVTNEAGGKATLSAEGLDASASLDSETATLSIVNEPFGAKVDFKKLDNFNDAVITGAVFGLYYTATENGEDGTYAKIATLNDADGDGYYHATGLTKGYYKLVEETSPLGYEVAAPMEEGSLGKVVMKFQVKVGQNDEVVDMYNGGQIEGGGANWVYNARIKGSASLVKTNNSGEPLAGTAFAVQVQDAATGEYAAYTNDNASGTYTTDASGKIEITNMPWGNYRIAEETPTEGYKAGSNAEWKTFQIGLVESDAGTQFVQTVDLGTLVNDELTAGFSFTKTELYNESCADSSLGGVDAAATRALQGAQFLLSGTSVLSASVSLTAASDESGKVSFTDVPVGTYTLSETAVPEGHVKAADRVVKVDARGAVSMGETAESQAVVDDATQIENDVQRAALKFTKVSELDKKTPIAGATYEIYRLPHESSVTGAMETDADGSEAAGGAGATEPVLIARATTASDGSIAFSGLLASERYQVTEVATAAGSLLSKNSIVVSFASNGAGGFTAVLDDAGTSSIDGASPTATLQDGNLVWLEPQTQYQFMKVDESGNLLAGATLQVQDAAGNVVDEWTSSANEAHALNGVLAAGESYKLVEIAAPSGYDVAEPVAFTVSAEAQEPGNDHVVAISMTDKKSPVSADGTKQSLVATGDTLNVQVGTGLAVVALASLAALTVAFVLRRRSLRMLGE